MQPEMRTGNGVFEGPLAALGEGEEGMLDRIMLPERQAARLKRLGFFSGVRVRVIRGGSPMIVEVLNTRIGLSGTIAGAIFLAGRAGGETAR